jgi:hypothetical protein
VNHEEELKMSIEKLIEGLTDAVNGLTAAIAANGGAMATPTAEEAKRPTKGRGKATDTQDADASGTSSESGSGSTAQTGTKEVVDAGTGQTVTVGGEDPKVDRAAVKKKGVALTQLNGGNDKLKELLVRHSPEGTEAVKFGTVLDEAMAAFEADIDEAIASLQALAD